MPILTFDDEVSGASTPSGRIYVSPARDTAKAGTKEASKALSFDEFAPEESTTGKVARYGKDIGLSVVSGLDKGVAGLAGLPADLALGVNYLVNLGKSKVQGRPFDEVEAESDRNAVISRDAVRAYGSQAAHANSPLRHEPETTPGRYAQTGAEFIPSAVLLRPAAIARNALASESGQDYF
jgi:hypothetical protein